MVNFTDPNLESLVESVYWDGRVAPDWGGDYFMMVDANMGSLKTDYYMKREISYDIDLTADRPVVTAHILAALEPQMPLMKSVVPEAWADQAVPFHLRMVPLPPTAQAFVASSDQTPTRGWVVGVGLTDQDCAVAALVKTASKMQQRVSR